MPERQTSARAGVRSSDRRHRAHPNPASPWVIDTREVGRRPGSMRSYRRTAAAPAGIGYDDVISVPAPVHGECSRCLDELDERIATTFTELFAYPESATDSTTDADEVSRVADDLVDVGSVVHDALLLAMPQAPLCTPDCPGLCPECGGKRADLGLDHEHETIDPRWAGLIERFGPDSRADQASDPTEEN